MVAQVLLSWVTLEKPRGALGPRVLFIRRHPCFLAEQRIQGLGNPQKGRETTDAPTPQEKTLEGTKLS